MAGASSPCRGDMKVGIYNRWIDTLGGGEQTLGAFALALAERHDVEVISHSAMDWERFRDTLGFDLSSIPTRVVPFDSDYRSVQSLTRTYDLFVNCSYLDLVRSFAPLNVMQVFFPDELREDRSPPPLPARPTGWSDVLAIGGLYDLEQHRGVSYAWSDGAARFAVRPAVPGDPFTLTVTVASNRPRQFSSASMWLVVDDMTITDHVTIPAQGFVRVEVTIPGELTGLSPMFVDVHSDTFDPSEAHGDRRPMLGLRISDVTMRRHQRSENDGISMRRATGVSGSSVFARWSKRWRAEEALDSYDLLLANSLFTQRWIARRYGRASELLYPPVQVGQFAPLPKRNQIISVGRFFVAGHGKKQLEMIALFRRLCDEGLEGWEYHLVGGTSNDFGYFRECVHAADGYPIHFHPDAPLRELARLYGESALCWNATGYGEDPERDPDRFEHFGMTTVEAMASGCVPLAHARAGQPEVVEHLYSGILWESLDDLAAETIRLIDDTALRDAMSVAAVRRSGGFTHERFQVTLRRLLADLRPGDRRT
jgi:glycosyltransferase involved in cell wall biosynthesis